MALVPDATAAANARPLVLMITNPVSNTCSETVSLGIGEKDRTSTPDFKPLNGKPEDVVCCLFAKRPASTGLESPVRIQNGRHLTRANQRCGLPDCPYTKPIRSRRNSGEDQFGTQCRRGIFSRPDWSSSVVPIRAEQITRDCPFSLSNYVVPGRILASSEPPTFGRLPDPLLWFADGVADPSRNRLIPKPPPQVKRAHARLRKRLVPFPPLGT